MQLTQFTDYSLRTLIYLAERPERLCTIAEIAGWYGISRAHLVKVAHRLSRVGYVASVQGNGGGLRLGRPASDILIGDVVRDVEPGFHIVECFDPTRNRCRIAGHCELQHVLSDAIRSFFDVIDARTLQSICNPQPQEPEEIHP